MYLYLCIDDAFVTGECADATRYGAQLQFNGWLASNQCVVSHAERPQTCRCSTAQQKSIVDQRQGYDVSCEACLDYRHQVT